MKERLSLISFLWLLLVGGLFAQTPKGDDTEPQKTKKLSKAAQTKQFSYAYGYNFAKELKENSSFEANEMSIKEILKGIKDGLKKDTAKLATTNAYLEKRLNDGVAAKTPEEGKKTAYHLGYNAVANMMAMLNLPASDFHYGSIKKGYTAYAKGGKTSIAVEEMETILTTYFQEKQEAMEAKMLAEREVEAQKMLTLGQQYLAENAKKEGVKTTASGLQYQVIKEGTGAQPTINSTVVTHYTGTLMNGKVFDSSIERGEPASFPLAEVIKGWQEGIPLMKVGSRYRLFVPAELGYGKNTPASIPPNSVLIFDVELLEILKDNPEATTKSKLSYTYGFVMGQGVENAGFVQAERNPQQFLQGFSKGFDAKPEEVLVIEKFLKNRIETGEAAQDEETAQKIAYAIGFISSSGIATQSDALATDFDFNAIGLGYTTAIKGEESKFSKAEMEELLRGYFLPRRKKMQEEEQAQQAAKAQENIKVGEQFLKENASKEGVVTLENGMQYIVLNQGTGKQKPSLEDKVTTHYHGTLIDGTVFDSSVERGEPATFPLNAVIEGWQKGIPLMSEGAKYRFFIPAHLAYGNRAMGPKIPAGSTLIFEVELIKIN